MGEIIRRDKLFGGRMSADELHVKYAWHGKKCSACGAPPALRIQSFILISDLVPWQKDHVTLEIAMGRLHPVKLEPGPALRYGDVYACSTCAPAAERQAAKCPSYMVVWLERSPGSDNPIVGVASSL